MMERSQNINFSDENKGRGLFYGVIAIAVFIIMAVGTTFAFFTATTSSADTAVQTGSTTLQLRYISYEEAWTNRDLIPADTSVVEYSFEYQSDVTVDTTEEDYETLRHNALCKDDYGNSICSVYVFQVENSANSPQTVSLDILSTENSFSSLHAMAYEISEPTADDTENYAKYFPTIPEGGDTPVFSNPLNGVGDPVWVTSDMMGSEEEEASIPEGAVSIKNGDGEFISYDPDEYNPVYVNRDGVIKTLLKYKESDDSTKPAIDRKIKGIDSDDRKVRVADDIEIDGKSYKTLAIVLYIKNENRDQTETDAAKMFSGQVIVGAGDDTTGVSGSISAAGSSGNNLQSAE